MHEDSSPFIGNIHGSELIKLFPLCRWTEFLDRVTAYSITPGWKQLLLSSAFVGTAMLCKEQGITVTGICAIYEIFVAQKVNQGSIFFDIIICSLLAASSLHYSALHGTAQTRRLLSPVIASNTYCSAAQIPVTAPFHCESAPQPLAPLVLLLLRPERTYVVHFRWHTTPPVPLFRPQWMGQRAGEVEDVGERTKTFHMQVAQLEGHS